MKGFSVLLRPRDAFVEQNIPAHRLDRIRGELRRRLSDQVDEVFNRACSEGDHRTAAALYAILEDMHARRLTKFGHERRISVQSLADARKALESCWALHKRDALAAEARLPKAA
jgi:hypothetical protein